ncbi:hypothetical protein AB0I30_32125 [Nocardia tengchongensis]|uniref:hypothetical protein n=1 Tax=Nocardia tengchongensis TaxID=2055889 RepID=UPI0033DBF7CC
MEDVVAFAIAIAPIALVAGAFGLVVVRARRKRLGGSIVGPFQEMWDPGARRIQIEVETRAEDAVPAPSPDDPLVLHDRRKGSRG